MIFWLKRAIRPVTESRGKSTYLHASQEVASCDAVLGDQSIQVEKGPIPNSATKKGNSNRALRPVSILGKQARNGVVTAS